MESLVSRLDYKILSHSTLKSYSRYYLQHVHSYIADESRSQAHKGLTGLGTRLYS